MSLSSTPVFSRSDSSAACLPSRNLPASSYLEGGGLGPRVPTLIFSYIRRLEPFLGVKTLNFILFCVGGGVRKMNIMGIKIL